MNNSDDDKSHNAKEVAHSKRHTLLQGAQRRGADEVLWLEEPGNLLVISCWLLR